jgi:hypothetical protein
VKLRFVRAIALVSGVACSSPREEIALADAGQSEGGSCVTFRDADVPCGAGKSCLIVDNLTNPDLDVVECRSSDAALEHECGAIRCGWECICGDPEKSVCACVYGMSGPLSPPDLPHGVIADC